MQISNHLVQQFLSGACTEEERRQVIAFFKNNPEKFAQYLKEEDWENFSPDDHQEVPTGKMRSYIENRVGRAPVKKINYRWMAAAAVIGLAGLISLFYLARDNKGKAATNIEAIQIPVKKEEKIAVPQTIANTSSKARLYTLPDGSKIKLAGNSELSFNNPFINNRRDIFLKGAAVFTVAKDKSKPFTVHSKNFTTTALGTVFSVNDRHSLFTTIHLYEGRIVIRKEEQTRGKSFKEVYLLPGQQLRLNKENFSVQYTTAGAIKKDTAGMVKAKLPQVITFTKQPLTEIFTLLQNDFHVTISYDAAAMKNIDFTGTFNPGKETLESFLNTLCTLNELTLENINSKSFSIKAN